jgi:hypothetical protein
LCVCIGSKARANFDKKRAEVDNTKSEQLTKIMLIERKKYAISQEMQEEVRMRVRVRVREKRKTRDRKESTNIV